MTKSATSEKLIFIIDNQDDEEIRIEAIELLQKVGFTSENVFKCM
ncbi:MAG: hypothetical protein ACFFDK_06820 [Promethearchaeota archaeon]